MLSGNGKMEKHPPDSWQIALGVNKKKFIIITSTPAARDKCPYNLDWESRPWETMQGLPFESIQKDFDAINTIIGSVTYEAIQEINRISPLLFTYGIACKSKGFHNDPIQHRQRT
ncbi:MAG: hypothetical protein WDM78_05020 [Puia sp.]